MAKEEEAQRVYEGFVKEAEKIAAAHQQWLRFGQRLLFHPLSCPSDLVLPAGEESERRAQWERTRMIEEDQHSRAREIRDEEVRTLSELAPIDNLLSGDSSSASQVEGGTDQISQRSLRASGAARDKQVRGQ